MGHVPWRPRPVAGVPGRASGDGSFGRIYGASSERSFLRRYLISFALAIATGGCFILAVLCLVLALFLIARHPGPAWGCSRVRRGGCWRLGLLSLAVGLLVHVASATHPPPAVGQSRHDDRDGVVGELFDWVLLTYLTSLASCGSAFGSLTSVIVVLTYL